MKQTLQIIGAFIALIIIILTLSWIFTGNDFFLYKYFAPKQAAVERQVFLNTPSYINGMNQQIQDEMFKYYENTNNQEIISSLVLQQTAQFPLDQMTSDNRIFVQKLRSQRMGANNF